MFLQEVKQKSHTDFSDFKINFSTNYNLIPRLRFFFLRNISAIS